jgi:GDPmannose 4,6-dehydratase
MATALITGVTGQDGWYLARQLLGAGWRVHGVARRSREVPVGTMLHVADATDSLAVAAVVARVSPDAIFHLAADSFVADGASTDAVVAAHRLAATALFDAWRQHAPEAHVVIASSAEVFGGTTQARQDATHPLQPVTAYGHGKAEVLRILRELRDRTGGHLSAGILYNHESERRDPRFLGRKVSLGVAAIATGRATELRLGNLEARRDWGYAPDYVDALFRMAVAEVPGDYVIGTGTTHSVREFCERAFDAAGLDYEAHVRTDAAFNRAADPASLVADPLAAERDLGWRATTPFPEMVAQLVRADLTLMREG